MGPEGFDPAAGRIGSAALVLSRGSCRFGRFDFTRIPAGKRGGALALKLPTWAPFRNPAYAVVWLDGVACVWGWDSVRLAAELARHGHTGTAFAQVLPETLLQTPGSDGLRLVRCRHGFEAQQWRQGQPISCRWWLKAPDDAAWLAFMRDIGVPLAEQVPLPQAEIPAQLAEPWARARAAAPGANAAPAWETWAYAALALALGMPAVVLADREIQVRQVLSQRQVEVESLRSASAPLLAARERALSTLQQIREIDSLQATPGPLRLMAAMAATLPRGDAVLREWNMADGRLQIVIASTTPPEAGPIAGAEYVAALERTGLVSNAKMVTQADPRQIGLSMNLRSLQELEAPDTAEPPAGRAEPSAKRERP